MNVHFEPSFTNPEGSASDRSSPFSSENSGGDSPQTVTTSIVRSPLSPNRPLFGSPLSFKDESSTPLASPVLEEDDDDDANLPIIKSEPGTSASTDVVPLIKRRGRPRKGVLPIESLSENKVPKGRSKTGCFTCRRRKKKCDERKPTCMHCEKNRVVCEGYPAVERWLSGRQRDARKRSRYKWETQGPPTLPTIFPFLEDELDGVFFEHFKTFASVLSPYKSKDNPFQDILLPMAMQHSGLMHMLLSLSGTHLRQSIADERGGNARLTARIEFHFEKGQRSIHEALELNDNTLAMATLHCVRTVVDGHHYGEWEPSLDVLKHGVNPPTPGVNVAFRHFLLEFFIYHKTAAMMTLSRGYEFDYVNLPGFLVAEKQNFFLGVCDGIIMSIAQVRQIRDRIRAMKKKNKASNNRFGYVESYGPAECEDTPFSGNSVPCVDYESIAQARDIEKYLQNCACVHEQGTEMWICWQIYRISAWLYMYRTVYNSQPSQRLDGAVSAALELLNDMDPDSGCQSMLLTPVFMLGCSAFNKDYRQPILDALETIERYSALGNIKHARAIVLRIWELMDSDDPREREASWDWEGIMDEMGLNLLLT